MNTNTNFIKKILKLQMEIDNVRNELEKKEFHSEIGDIIIILQGTRKVVDVQILSPKILKDKYLLQENILLAFNDALEKIDVDFKKMINKITGGI
ncbi:YbaB/EbfC family nucleoid-associated protein [Candidatus Phytoplasma prunorum]|uniref:YbaB/EbfC family nucleoid-associated protein n=1 Tax=Candidatus Phytoplasma prunorum TaxID=47565 RepID=UPI002FEEB096